MIYLWVWLGGLLPFAVLIGAVAKRSKTLDLSKGTTMFSAMVCVFAWPGTLLAIMVIGGLDLGAKLTKK